MDFVAIDFETASAQPNSACQLGMVRVSNGQIREEYCWLIRPPRLYFSPRNIAIHGIRPQQVSQAPTMKTLWQEVELLLQGQMLLAHNARFDINVLIQSLAAYDIVCPQLEFHCTRALARSAWPGRSRYGLKPLGNALGIRFEHHDALEDARCCAQIALAISKQYDGGSLEDLEAKLQIKRGKYADGRVHSPLAKGRRQQGRATQSSTDRWGFPGSQRQPLAGVDASAVMRAAADSLPLAGKQIVLLGPLRGLTALGSQLLIERLGGVCQPDISPQTDFVVACGTTLDAARQRVAEAMADFDPGKQDTAPASTGFHLRLLSERQFRALLPGGKAAAW